MDIETATQKAQKSVTHMNNVDTSVLPLEPISGDKTVLTAFCATNFGKNVDKDMGGGPINMATLRS